MDDYKKKQKELTELNADGNEGVRDRDGADITPEPGKFVDYTKGGIKALDGEDVELTEEEALKKKIEELRKRDPFIYR